MLALPRSKATLIPWTLATVLYVFVFSIRETNARWTFVVTPKANPVQALLEGAALALFGGVLLWQQLRMLYLTPRTQAPAFLCVWLLFIIGYPVIGGMIALFRPEVTWVGFDWPRVDWTLMAVCVAAGQYAFIGAVVLSLIWKTDEPGYGPIRLSRNAALLLLRLACGGKTQLTPPQRSQLVYALNDLSTTAAAASAKAVSPQDASLLQRWGRAAERLHGQFQHLASADIDERKCRDAAADITDLRQEG